MGGIDTGDTYAAVYGDPGNEAVGVFFEGGRSGGERPEGVEGFGGEVVVGERLA